MVKQLMNVSDFRKYLLAFKDAFEKPIFLRSKGRGRLDPSLYRKW
jgi:hypothetical protein